jgi:hypothetical protein
VAERRGAKSRIAEVELPWGGAAHLGERDFRPVANEELVARGGRLELHAASVAPVVGLELAPLGAATWAARVGVAGGWARGALALALELDYLQGDAHTAGYEGQERAVAGAALVGVRGFVGRATLSLFVGPELRWTWQSLTRLDAARLAAAGLPTNGSRSGGGIGPRAAIVLAIPLGRRWSALVGVAATALVERESAGGSAALSVSPLVSATVGVAHAF